jgi:hypothetical protein
MNFLTRSLATELVRQYAANYWLMLPELAQAVYSSLKDDEDEEVLDTMEGIIAVEDQESGRIEFHPDYQGYRLRIRG